MRWRTRAGIRLALSVLAISTCRLRADDPRPATIEPLRTSITVVEKIAAETPSAVEEIGREKLRRTPGVNLDDRLRDVPGFSLFRRSSSLTAHPTTQGVSLRGIGGSGASRTLVLWDGVPLNDPFGGWVYWTRVAPESLERVEVSRAASTSAFGDRAMGGVVALFSREPAPRRFDASYLGGNRDTHELAAGASHVWSRWGLSGRARAFTTDGYFIVPEERRGLVDRRAAVRFVSGESRVDFLRARDRLFLRADLLAEERANGTALQRNSTGLGSAALRYLREGSRIGVSLTARHAREEFRSAFSAIGADRDSERLTSLQSVPAEAAGGSGFLTYRGGTYHLLAGAEASRTEGYSRETLFPSGRRVGGGILNQQGTFAQADFALGPAKLFLGARHDFTGQDRSFFSPSAGVMAGAGRIRVRASAYRSFRAPTLNELHREFRVGNAVTQANAALRPERLAGVEAGIDITGETARGSVTLYRSSLADLITNVTLSASPNLIVRQRRNAASAVSRGIEFDGRARRGSLLGEVAYLFADSRFRDGFRIPQTPRHQGSARLTYSGARTVLSLAARSFSAQFEDERNLREFLLPGFATVQFTAIHRLAAGLSAQVSVENALDRSYVVALSPAPNTGAPRLWRAGLRWESR